MTTQVHALIKESPELAQDLQDMCDDDANFARQAAEFAVLAERLAAVQTGNESLSAEDRLLLEQQCSAQQAILLRKLTHPAGGCCGGCGG